MKNYGIQKLSFLLSTGFDLFAQLKQIFADKKVKTLEIVGLVPYISDVESVVKDSPEALKEFKDLDSNEAAKIEGIISEKLAVEGDKAKKIAVAIFNLLRAVHGLLSALKTEVSVSS